MGPWAEISLNSLMRSKVLVLARKKQEQGKETNLGETSIGGGRVFRRALNYETVWMDI